MPKCATCQEAILDKYVLRVEIHYFHMKCLKCADCELKLSEKCYYRDGRVYCREDFFRKFGTKCSGCGNGISPTEPVRRAGSAASNNSVVYHLGCFACKACRMELQTGDEFYLMEDKKLMCKSDYETAKARGKFFTRARALTFLN